MKIQQTTISALLVISAAVASIEVFASDPTPTLARGKAVFVERCVLCHGPTAKGDGHLARTVTDYPSTNLHGRVEAFSRNEMIDAVVWGGSDGALHAYSPPWGNELTWSEIESVATYTKLLVTDSDAAAQIEYSTDAAPQDQPLLDLGREKFQARCVLCHGETGLGDGRLSKAITDPPPANLVISGLSRDDLREIIMAGGAAVGRSQQMPSWKDELTVDEVDAVVAYVFSLRISNRNGGQQ